MWDRLLSFSEPQLLHFFEDAHPRLAEGVRMILAGEPALALAQWGAPERDARVICDADAPLAFSNVVDTLRAGLATIDMPHAHRFGAAVAATALAAPRLAALDRRTE